MLLTKQPNIRVVIGPGVNQYGIIGKPFKPPKENILEKTKRLDEAFVSMQAQETELQNGLLKIDFFERSDKKAKYKQLKRTVDEIMNQRNFLLSERRNKLKQLLLNEEQQYERELESLIETPLERASRLRERAKKIREEREEEKKAFVDEKLDQKWRSECDELRTLQSKYLQSEMRLEHLRQMEENACKERQKMADEAMYAELWHNDAMAKRAKEHAEAKLVAQRNMETAEVLKEQMKVLDKQREEEKRLRIENARLAHERVSVDKMEKQLAHQNKLRLQAARKDELDQNLRIKMRREQRLAQQELALDLKLLEEALASYEGEERDKAIRKQELYEEGKRYRAYLHLLREEEKREEEELDKLVDIEVERLFQKRLNQWKAERAARQKLLEEVLVERRQQVEDNMRRNEERQRQLEKEKKELNENIKYYKELERQDQLNLLNKNRGYQSDLVNQMEYNLQQKEKERFFDILEYQSCVKAEDEFKRRLNDNIKNLRIDRVHPIRSYSTPNYEAGSGYCGCCKLKLAQAQNRLTPGFKTNEKFCTCPIVYN